MAFCKVIHSIFTKVAHITLQTGVPLARNTIESFYAKGFEGRLPPSPRLRRDREERFKISAERFPGVGLVVLASRSSDSMSPVRPSRWSQSMGLGIQREIPAGRFLSQLQTVEFDPLRLSLRGSRCSTFFCDSLCLFVAIP